MKIFLHLAAALAVALPALADVKLTPGEISDRRTTGEFHQGLEIKVKLSGPELLKAKGARVAVTAKDDSGKALEESKGFKFDKGGFEKLEKPFGFGGEKKVDEFELKFDFANPPRAAKSVTIVGHIELLIPELDPAAVITVDPVKTAGTAVDNAALKAAGVEITFKAPKGSEVAYTLKDPKKIIASVEPVAADGTPLKTNGRSSSSFGGGPASVSLSLEDPAPKGMAIKLHLATEKAVLKVPVKLDAVPLP